MRVRADQRSREIHAAPRAERDAREARREIARAELRAARALSTIESNRSYVRHGFASVHAWAADAGYGPQQTWRLLALGRTLVAAPELGPKVRAGTLPAEAAVSLGRVLLEPTLKLGAAERAEWVAKAVSIPPAALRDQAEKAVEDARGGAPTLPLRLLVTKGARDGFHRARLLMSRGEPRWITEGATFCRLVSTWLKRHDPRNSPLPRRVSGPTEGRVTRYVPRKVAAIIERRSGGKCEVCRTRRATQRIHVRKSHANGGAREVDNLADACGDCHVLVDAGVFGFSHFDRAGKPQWNYHPKALYGPLGRQQPLRVREPRAARYITGSRVARRHKRTRSGAAQSQRAPPLS